MIDEVYKLDNLKDLTTLRKILQHIHEQAVGSDMITADPTNLGTGKLVALDDGTDANIIFKSGKGNVLCGVPRGTILLWSGASSAIPYGFVLCNGSNGTPDLRNRFVVGAGSTYAVANTGGATSVDTSHQHNVPIGDGAGGNLEYDMDEYGGGASFTADKHYNLGPDTEARTTTGMYTSTAGSATLSILNPYYALCYIMKT